MSTKSDPTYHTRYDRCNIADVPAQTWTTDAEYQEGYTACYDALYSPILSRCHGKLIRSEFNLNFRIEMKDQLF